MLGPNHQPHRQCCALPHIAAAAVWAGIRLRVAACATLPKVTQLEERGPEGHPKRISSWRVPGPIRVRAPLHELLSGTGPLAAETCQMVGGGAAPSSENVLPRPVQSFAQVDFVVRRMTGVTERRRITPPPGPALRPHQPCRALGVSGDVAVPTVHGARNSCPSGWLGASVWWLQAEVRPMFPYDCHREATITRILDACAERMARRKCLEFAWPWLSYGNSTGSILRLVSNSHIDTAQRGAPTMRWRPVSRRSCAGKGGPEMPAPPASGATFPPNYGGGLQPVTHGSLGLSALVQEHPEASDPVPNGW